MAGDVSSDRGSRIGLALAGGGIEGAVYEIGALRALDEAVGGLDLNRLDIYVGVSAGAFVGACLANGLTPADLAATLASRLPYGVRIDATTFMTPAFGEFARRWLRIPRVVFEAAMSCAAHPLEVPLGASLGSRIWEALPVAIFDNEPIRRLLAEIFGKPGRTDDFRLLPRKLVVVAADLDSAQAVRFGDPGLDDVPISRAVQASAALPGLYPPVPIKGHYYVDGVLLKTMHASVALEAGADLVICMNPFVPIDTSRRSATSEGYQGPLLERGLAAVLQQTLRTIIHSRMSTGMAAYGERFPDRDVVLFEPEPDDYWMFFTNVFSFLSRKSVCEHAYAQTRRSLRQRFDELQPVFARHGLTLRQDVLEDPDRDLWAGLPSTRVTDELPVTRTLDALLGRLDEWLANQERKAPPGPDSPPPSAAGATP